MCLSGTGAFSNRKGSKKKTAATTKPTPILNVVTCYDADEASLDRAVFSKVVQQQKAAAALTVSEIVSNPFASPAWKPDHVYNDGRSFTQNALFFSVF